MNPRAEYTRRMHRVLAHIDAHLSEPLTLAGLAEVAHFSPFHFHRLFTAWAGETVAEHVRRRRVEVAALRLLTQPRAPVLEIALLVGFGSGEALAHAFKARFGCSASQWRRGGAASRAQQLRKLDQALRKPDQAAGPQAPDDGGTPTPEGMPMNVSVVERSPVRVAYLRHVGPYGPGVHAFWQAKFVPFLARHQLFGRPIYGVSHDDPLIAPPDKLRYDCCVAVDDGFVPSGDAQIITIAGGRYASLPFEGTSDALGAQWMALMRDWLPGSGWQLDGRPTFEYYPPGAAYDETTGRFSCEIVIPLAPL
jgi:AraC family transcriptional regulator